jgi:hypothetical protein
MGHPLPAEESVNGNRTWGRAATRVNTPVSPSQFKLSPQMFPFKSRQRCQNVNQAVIVFFTLKGSRKISLQFPDVEAPAWKGVATQEYQAYFQFPRRSQAGWINCLKCEVIFK